MAIARETIHNLYVVPLLSQKSHEQGHCSVSAAKESHLLHVPEFSLLYAMM
jgi:hypothetical protein